MLYHLVNERWRLHKPFFRFVHREYFKLPRFKGMHVGLNRLKEQMRDYFQKRKGHDEAARRAAGLPPRPPEQWDYADGWILKADVHHLRFPAYNDLFPADFPRRKVFFPALDPVFHPPYAVPAQFHNHPAAAV